MRTSITRVLYVLTAAALGQLMSQSATAADCAPFRRMLTGMAHQVMGLKAPVPMFAGQIKQESGCQPGITSWDNGRGLAQFMDGTAATVQKLFPDLGESAPYSPEWAIPAMIRYDKWLSQGVQGATECELWGAALKSYNAGPGWVQKAQQESAHPDVWFGVTELINSGQTAKSFGSSQLYPRVILLEHQAGFATWGDIVCEPTSNLVAPLEFEFVMPRSPFRNKH
jgi:hypothetical protein